MVKPEAQRRRKTGQAVASVAVEGDVGVVNTEAQTEAVPRSEVTVLPPEPKKVRKTSKKKAPAKTELLSEDKGLEGVDAVSLVVSQVKECLTKKMDGANGSHGDITVKTVKNVNGKRKAQECMDGTSPKKTKTINNDFRVFVSNLNNTMKYDKVKDSLAHFLSEQDVLVQGISLDPSRKYAHVDLATEVDLTKALALNGSKVLNTQIKVRKPRITKDETEIIAASEAKKAKDARSVFLKNVPCNATKKDILKVFNEAVGVRFPGRTLRPSKGFAIVEFETKDIAEQVLNTKVETKLEDNVLILECVKEGTSENSQQSPVEAQVQSSMSAVQSNTLFVNNVPFKLRKKEMKTIFKNAVKITLSKVVGASNRFAFVEFKTVEDAMKALETSQNKEIAKRTLRVQFSNATTKPANGNVVTNSLLVKGLSEGMDEDTLKNAFEGSTGARIITDKRTGVSRGVGLVFFERDEDCSVAMETMKDCNIGGRRVTLAYGKHRAPNMPSTGLPKGPRKGLKGQPEGQDDAANCGGPDLKKVVKNTLIVKGLSEETDVETLKNAFDRSTDAKIIAGVSKGVGFVFFDCDEDCSVALETMKDCNIGGRRVTLGYAKQIAKRGHRGGLKGRPGGQVAADKYGGSTQS